MIEIQCTSCHTRYRIDERVLPDDTPTFKCSRCGHVFNADPVPAKVRKPAAPAPENESPEPRTLRPARPRPSGLKSPVESDVVKREHGGDARSGVAPKPAAKVQESQPEPPPRPEARVQKSQPEPRRALAPQPPPAAPSKKQENPITQARQEPELDDPLNRTFGDPDQKADTGENLRFDFSDERNQMGEASADPDLERPEHEQDRWQVGDTRNEFESAPSRQAPTTKAEPAQSQRPVRRMASVLSADAPHEHELERPEGEQGRWQVGDAHSEFESESRRQAPAMRAEPTRSSRPVRRMASALDDEDVPGFAPPPPAKSAGFQIGQVDDEPEPVAPGSTHASGMVLALFFFVAIAFLGVSALICDEPSASARILSETPRIGGYFARPIVPAMLVTLHDVHSEYYTLKGGHVALVITGTVQNVGAHPLHLVGIAADLIGAGARPLASQSVYCGNELSAKMLGEMTPREIEFSQALSPPKSFAMDPAASAPFLMVFIDPPTGAGKIRISVSKADAGANAAPPA